MRRLRHGWVPAFSCRALAWIGILALAAAIGGCAATSADGVGDTRSIVTAGRGATEDDGLPPQAAPSLRVRQLPDDPSEPFSRNYGPRPPMRLQAMPARMSDAECDALIARAITEHEMRRP